MIPFHTAVSVTGHCNRKRETVASTAERLDPEQVLGRLRDAVDDHDLDALASCFAENYVNETPAHPLRSFQGVDQVRANWDEIFAGVPDIRARILRMAADGDTVWSEWEMTGRRVDAGEFLMRGVVIFTIPGPTITAARFYLEPVEETSGNADDHARRVAGTHARELS